MVNDIATLTKYNLWANQRIADWLLANETDKLEASCKSSFSTIISTVNHIWDAEIFYLSLLKEIPVSKDWNKTTEGAIKGLVEQSKEFANYASQLGEDEQNERRPIQVRTMTGDFSRSELIQHCMNHSTYHRGQLVTIGHQLNLTRAPSTDLFFFLFKQKRRSNTQ